MLDKCKLSFLLTNKHNEILVCIWLCIVLVF